MADDHKVLPITAANSGRYANWADPDLFLFENQRAATPDFKSLLTDETGESLLGAFGEYVLAAGDGSNLPHDYIAAWVLGCVTGLFNKTAIARITKDWHEPAALWIACVGSPSSKKSPSGYQARRAVTDCESAIKESHEHRIDADMLDLERGGKANPKVEAAMAALERERGKPPRYLMGDTTPEALARTSARSPWGMCIARDEMSGMLLSDGSYKSGPFIPFALEGFSRGSYTVDRVNLDRAVTINQHVLSIVGNIQPDCVDSLMLSGDDNGLPERFLYFWPDRKKLEPLTEGMDHSNLHQAFEIIAEWGRRETTYFDLTDDARVTLDDWRMNTLEPHLAAENRLSGACGKYEGTVTRVALVLQILNWGFERAAHPELKRGLSEEITQESLLAAINMFDRYFIPQARRVFMSEPRSISLARKVINYVLTNREYTFQKRDFQRTSNLGGKNANEYQAAINELVYFNLIRRTNNRAGGRNEYEVNPKLIDWHSAQHLNRQR